jgi:hypothetical protein
MRIIKRISTLEEAPPMNVPQVPQSQTKCDLLPKKRSAGEVRSVEL